jgi:hypothetical protein
MRITRPLNAASLKATLGFVFEAAQPSSNPGVEIVIGCSPR